MQNTSKSINNVAKLLSVVEIVVSIIYAIILWIQGASSASSYSSSSRAFFYILSGFVVLILGILFSYVTYYLIIGFSELVENSHNINNKMDNIKNELKNIRKSNVKINNKISKINNAINPNLNKVIFPYVNTQPNFNEIKNIEQSQIPQQDLTMETTDQTQQQ